MLYVLTKQVYRGRAVYYCLDGHYTVSASSMTMSLLLLHLSTTRPDSVHWALYK